jgi:hypothetical protein
MCREVFEISGAHCVSVTRSPWKRREVTIGVNRFCQHPAARLEQAQQFPSLGAKARCVFLDYASRFFKAEKGRGVRCHVWNDTGMEQKQER